ncbi:hypothetical protein SAMN06295888_1564 [Desulfonatronum zhilinae]|nr:hypothetical protein SAMN06295888_1564 [Desulfonatronum zhilinae]
MLQEARDTLREFASETDAKHLSAVSGFPPEQSESGAGRFAQGPEHAKKIFFNLPLE